MSFAGIKSKKVDNHAAAMPAKIKIRENVRDALGEVRVFDAFAGTGKLHDAVWSKAALYVGCDLRWIDDARLAFVADNRRVLRAIDLRPFNVFDCDAYGSPWECLCIVAARRPVASGERLGVIITDGAGIAYRANSLPTAVKALTGLSAGLVGVSRLHDDIIDRAVAGLAKRMRCDVEKRWQAERNDGSAPRYIGLVLKGQ
jgi:hypothetical protein